MTSENETTRDGLFVGSNIIEINHATMLAVLTEWLRREVASPLHVTDCTAGSRSAQSFLLSVKVGA